MWLGDYVIYQFSRLLAWLDPSLLPAQLPEADEPDEAWRELERLGLMDIDRR